MIAIIWNWSPGSDLGPFKFNSNINDYVEIYSLKKDLEEVDVTGWVTYKVPNTEISIDVEDGRIVSIASYDFFCFKNENIIGMQLSTLLELMLSHKYEVGETTAYDDGDIQTAYEFDSSGLQVWESAGLIVGAACREI